MSLPSQLHDRLYNTLLRCDPFRNDDALEAVFVDARISQWAADLPEANSQSGRVRATIKYLADQRNIQGENALVLFLRVLCDGRQPTDNLHRELAELASELEKRTRTPTPGTQQWDAALERYRDWVRKRYSTVRVLGIGGKYRSVPLEGIYTDVNLLEEPARWRYTIEEEMERLDGLELVKQLNTQILVILGKPGAGKTTFLKHIALQAAKGELSDYVPILIELRKWNGDDLTNFLVKSFVDYDFINPRADVEHLLKTGCALILLDGMDEIGEKKQRNLIRKLEAFSERHLDCHILLTRRTAASLYQFERSQTVEVANFTDDQMRTFATNWFEENVAQAEQFIRQIERDERLKDLGRSPLLLGLLCFIFDERGAFPKKRTDLYWDALNKLLVQWDKSWNIKRDIMQHAENYHNLSLGRKHQLFAYIAHATFEQGQIIPQKRLETLIKACLVTVPDAPERIDIEAGAILRAIEAQHGILVEQARGVYTFAHPTFQEYYEARYLVAQAEAGDQQAIPCLLTHAHGYRWREVILLAASMLSNADAFFEVFLARLEAMVKGDDKLVEFLAWVERKAASVDVPYKPAAVRAYYAWIALDHAFTCNRVQTKLALGLNLARAISLTLDLADALGLVQVRGYDLVRNLTSDFEQVCAFALALDLALARGLAFAITRDFASKLAREFASALHLAQKLGFISLYCALITLVPPTEEMPEEAWSAFAAQLQAIMVKHRDIGHDWTFTTEQAKCMRHHFTATGLVVKCLNIANISNVDPAAIEDRLLLPPAVE